MRTPAFATFIWDEIESLHSFIVEQSKEISLHPTIIPDWRKGRVSYARTMAQHFVRIARREKLKNPYRQAKVDRRNGRVYEEV